MTPRFITITGGGNGNPTRAAHDLCIISEELACRLKDVVYEYSGRLPLTLVLGALRVVEHELIDEHR
jgi:hypothetical protein